MVVTAQITTSGGKKTIRYTDLGGSYSYHTDRSQYIMSQSLPILRQEFLSAEREHPDGLGRDRHEPGVRAVAPVGAAEALEVALRRAATPPASGGRRSGA